MGGLLPLSLEQDWWPASPGNPPSPPLTGRGYRHTAFYVSARSTLRFSRLHINSSQNPPIPPVVYFNYTRVASCIPPYCRIQCLQLLPTLSPSSCLLLFLGFSIEFLLPIVCVSHEKCIFMDTSCVSRVNVPHEKCGFLGRLCGKQQVDTHFI